jgi:hypothetical protein
VQTIPAGVVVAGSVVVRTPILVSAAPVDAAGAGVRFLVLVSAALVDAAGVRVCRPVLVTLAPVGSLGTRWSVPRFCCLWHRGVACHRGNGGLGLRPRPAGCLVPAPGPVLVPGPVGYAIDLNGPLSVTPLTLLGDVDGVVDRLAGLSVTPSTRPCVRPAGGGGRITARGAPMLGGCLTFSGNAIAPGGIVVVGWLGGSRGTPAQRAAAYVIRGWGTGDADHWLVLGGVLMSGRVPR